MRVWARKETSKCTVAAIWSQLERMAHNTDHWRTVIDGLCTRMSDGLRWIDSSRSTESLRTTICNGNRTEWNPVRSVIIRVMTKSDDPAMVFITSMITDRFGRQEVLLPINHKNYNFRGRKNSRVMKERENLHKKTNKGGGNCRMVVIGWFKLQL